MKKKGDVISAPIVGIILLVIGFVIILIVYSQLGWKGQVDREVCHDSVILRASAPDLAKGYIPLRCKTEKICFGGECSVYSGADGVDNVKVSDKYQIEKYISEEIVDCWAMMGEGKVSLFSDYLVERGFGESSSSCVICSRISFNKTDLDKYGVKEEDMENFNLLNYMLTHKVQGKEISYIDYLSGESPARISVEDVNKIVLDGEVVEINSVEEDRYGEVAVLFMQVSSPEWDEAVKKSLQSAGIFGGSFLLASGGTGAGLAVKVVSSNPILTLFSVVGGAGYQGYNVWNNQNIAAGYCGDLYVESGEAKKGCSAVRLVKYDVQNIKEYCNNIESIS